MNRRIVRPLFDSKQTAYQLYEDLFKRNYTMISQRVVRIIVPQYAARNEHMALIPAHYLHINDRFWLNGITIPTYSDSIGCSVATRNKNSPSTSGKYVQGIRQYTPGWTVNRHALSRRYSYDNIRRSICSAWLSWLPSSSSPSSSGRRNWQMKTTYNAWKNAWLADGSFRKLRIYPIFRRRRIHCEHKQEHVPAKSSPKYSVIQYLKTHHGIME